MMVKANFYESGSNEQLVNRQKKHTRGDSLTIEGRISGVGLLTNPLPVVTFTGANSPDGKNINAQVFIEPITATVTLNEAIGGFNVVIPLLPEHTEEREVGEIIFWDIQFVQASPKIVQTWKGSILIEPDINMVQ